MRQVLARGPVTPEQFHREVRPKMQPVLLKGQVQDWPVVRAAIEGEQTLRAAISANAARESVLVSIGAADARGRFHYADNEYRLNFERTEMAFADLLDLLEAEAGKVSVKAIALQGQSADRILPGFSGVHPMSLLPPTVQPRLWIGNAVHVAIHNDELENIACVAGGRRRFTLFPPEQIGNLYMGPFELTPGGTPISMADPVEPDLEKFPRFANALANALVAELEPGDALYVPYQWYHHVQSLEGFNMLVNYWWDPARQDLGSPWDALLHGMIALRGLPADQRKAWRAAFDHYVFLEHGDPGEHLPPDWRGVLGATSPEAIADLQRDLSHNLTPGQTRRQGPLA